MYEIVKIKWKTFRFAFDLNSPQFYGKDAINLYFEKIPGTCHNTLTLLGDPNLISKFEKKKISGYL